MAKIQLAPIYSKIFLTKYYHLVDQFMQVRNHPVSKEYQKLQQEMIALDDVDFVLKRYLVPELRYEIEEVSYLAKTKQAFPDKLISDTQSDLKPIPREIILHLRRLYYQNLVMRRAYIDDLQSFTDTECDNPNYDYRLEAFDSLFKLWKIDDQFSDLANFVNQRHYTQTLASDSTAHYQQTDNQGQILKKPEIPPDVLR